MQRGVAAPLRDERSPYTRSDGKKIQKVTDAVMGAWSVVKAVSFSIVEPGD